MLERGGKKHETEIKVRCFNDKGKPFNKKYDEWISFDDADRLRPLRSADDANDADGAPAEEEPGLPEDALPTPPARLPELWLALVTQFEVAGGFTADGIFRASANKEALDECERELFNPSDHVDANGTKAQQILSPHKDAHVRDLARLHHHATFEQHSHSPHASARVYPCAFDSCSQV